MLRVNKVLRLIQQDYNRDLWWVGLCDGSGGWQFLGHAYV
jgi:hypothetical protein